MRNFQFLTKIREMRNDENENVQQQTDQRIKILTDKSFIVIL